MLSMSTKKKQSFLGGAAILASAVAIVKGIGFFYKIPLNNILGEEGKTYFDSAYQIYNVLLSISTAGLPLALSKLVSEAQARGRENEKRKLDKAKDLDIITDLEYEEKLEKARKRFDNFEMLKKVQMQFEMDIITREEYEEKVRNILQ